jgi:serine protease inhibitor
VKKPEYLLNMGTRMYVRKDVNVRSRFSKILQSFYNASTQQMDFDRSAEAAETVNSWVSEITSGRIKAMLSAGKHVKPVHQNSANVYSNSEYTYFPNTFFASLHISLTLMSIY